MNKSRLLGAVCAISLVFPISSHAAFVIYTDRVSFEADAGLGLEFESFESNPQLGASVTYGSLTFTESGGTNAITNTAIDSSFTAATTDGNYSIWFDDNVNSIATLTTSFAGSLTALGLDIATLSASTVTIGGDISGSLNLAASVPGFFGVISSTPLSSVTFSASGHQNVGFDAVSFGTAVPIPASVWLFGFGLLGLVGMARRKS